MADYSQPLFMSKRVRFFDGQFLQDQDFIDEQKFHLDRERRQSVALRLTGVCDGLTVRPKGTGTVTVAAGTAIDDLGRHLVLDQDTDLDVDGDGADLRGVEIALVYRETATDATQTGGVGARRWDESPKIIARDADGGVVGVAPAGADTVVDGPVVVLATVTVSEQGQITVGAETARRSSLAVSGALGVGSFALEHDRTAPTPGLHLRALGQNGATRLVIGDNGNVGIGAATPGSALEIGDFSANDRLLTINAGAEQSSGIQLWAGNAGRGVSLVHERRAGSEAGMHLRFHDQDVNGTTQLFVGPTGHVGIGTTVSPQPAGNWGRVVDVVSPGSAKLSVRGLGVDASVQVTSSGGGSMLLGTATAHHLGFFTNNTRRLTFDADGTRATFVSPNSEGTVDVIGHKLRLYRGRIASTEAPNRRVYLEMRQDDGAQQLPSAGINLLMTHTNRWGHRIEADSSGINFRGGDLNRDDEYRPIRAARVTATGLTIGSTTIGEAELAILKKLAAGTLKVDIFNVQHQMYLFMLDGDGGPNHKKVAGLTGSRLPESHQFEIRSVV